MSEVAAQLETRAPCAWLFVILRTEQAHLAPVCRSLNMSETLAGLIDRQRSVDGKNCKR